MDTNDYLEYIELNSDALSFLGYAVDTFGKVLGFGEIESKEDRISKYHHDYVYFCISKATRSLLAANEIAKFGLREDAMTLSRSAYETYLLLANAVNEKKFTVKSVIVSLGLRDKLFEHPKNSNGRRNYRKARIVGQEKVFDYDLGISTLSKNTYNSIDSKIHKEFYKYISEYSHSDFIGAGNYRTMDNTRYDVEPTLKHLDTVFIISYLCLLIIESLHTYHNSYHDFDFIEFNIEEILNICAIEEDLRSYCHKAIDNLDMSAYRNDFKKNLQKRVEGYKAKI